MQADAGREADVDSLASHCYNIPNEKGRSAGQRMISCCVFCPIYADRGKSGLRELTCMRQHNVPLRQKTGIRRYLHAFRRI